MALGVAEDRYAFWLGSGISLGRVPGVLEIVKQVLEFLRTRITPGAGPCRFRQALTEALRLASVSDDELTTLDFSRPFPDWSQAEEIVRRLVTRYAQLLDIPVDGEADDFLLWEAVNVVATYGNPSLQPDVEHLCIAILILEGTASDVATANWDGLIERAENELMGGSGQSCLLVCIQPTDLRGGAQRGNLYKFHGCAIRAMANEPVYRPLLVARQSQINAWISRPERAAIVGRLIDILVNKPSLVLGLSTQDANIQALFATAEATMRWTWPGDRPSYVFSENELGADQRGLLKNVYREAWTAGTRAQISDSAHLKAYAKPLLLALVLHVICTKLKRLIDLAEGLAPGASRVDLQSGVRVLRDRLADAGDGDRLVFLRNLIQLVSRAIMLFRDGEDSGAPRRYNPVTVVPLQQIASDPELPASGRCEAAVAMGLLGLGMQLGHWTVAGTDPTRKDSGIAQITSAASAVRILLVANVHAALYLRHSGYIVDEEDFAVIHSLEIPTPLPRSPRSAPGRTGKVGLREVSIRTLMKESASTSELLSQFRLRLAI
jgi:hypothetical protein